MIRKIAFSLIVLALASALVGGATLALFTDQATADPVAFTTGTVEITGRDLYGDVSVSMVTSSLDMSYCSPHPPNDPEQKTVTWCVENTGSKAAYIRVKETRQNEDVFTDQSAAGKGDPYGNSQGWHFMYLAFHFDNDVEEYELVTGKKYRNIGRVIVSRDEENYQKLYVSFETINGWTLTNTKVLASYTTVDFPNGHREFMNSGYLNNVTAYTHEIPYGDIYNGDGDEDFDTVYLATHADVDKLASVWTLNTSSSLWIQSDDGWWYYPTPVPAGEKVCISFDVLYYDSDADYRLEAEAVQASHNAINNINSWQGNPF